jgi:hypothetical protein
LRQLCARIDRTAVISPSSGRYAVTTTETRCGASIRSCGTAEVSRSKAVRLTFPPSEGQGRGSSARNAASHGSAGRAATNGLRRSTSSAARAAALIRR